MANKTQRYTSPAEPSLKRNCFHSTPRCLGPAWRTEVTEEKSVCAEFFFKYLFDHSKIRFNPSLLKPRGPIGCQPSSSRLSARKSSQTYLKFSDHSCGASRSVG